MGMEGMPQPTNNQEEQNLIQEKSGEQNVTNPVDRLDNLARGMSLKDGLPGNVAVLERRP